MLPKVSSSLLFMTMLLSLLASSSSPMVLLLIPEWRKQLLDSCEPFIGDGRKSEEGQEGIGPLPATLLLSLFARLR